MKSQRDLRKEQTCIQQIVRRVELFYIPQLKILIFPIETSDPSLVAN